MEPVPEAFAVAIGLGKCEETGLRTTFVLGAGFTKAFVPAAPLLVDDFDFPRLKKRFKEFEHAQRALRDARAAQTPRRRRKQGRGQREKIDLERLLTRLEGMPYDSVQARNEFALLGTAVKKTFVDRIERARKFKMAKTKKPKLNAFARFILENKASVVTFNYDDVLDAALNEVASEMHSQSGEKEMLWHPDTGYGFYCRPSETTVLQINQPISARTRSLLLKLHGSINWRSRLGESPNRGPAALLHHESWRLPAPLNQPMEQIESHLEAEPFMVPPVLAKTELHQHPVLGVVWRTAYDKLKAADKVMFIGYSMPTTDLAARTLFSEAIGAGTELLVVDYTENGRENERLMGDYRSLFKHIRKDQFDFRGALKRIEEDFS